MNTVRAGLVAGRDSNTHNVIASASEAIHT
jgi:hypothetical protein